MADSKRKSLGDLLNSGVEHLQQEFPRFAHFLFGPLRNTDALPAHDVKQLLEHEKMTKLDEKEKTDTVAQTSPLLSSFQNQPNLKYKVQTSKINIPKDRIAILQKEEILKAQVSGLQENVSGANTEINHLKNIISQMKNEEMERRRKHEEETKSLQASFMEEKIKIAEDNLLERKVLEDQIVIFQEQEKLLKTQVSDLRENVSSVESIIEQMKNEEMAKRRKYEEEIDIIQSRTKKCVVQVFYQGKGDLMKNIIEGLKTKLVGKTGMKHHEIQFVLCLSRSDVDTDLPLLAFCTNVSRLGTDASTALQNIPASHNVILLILHHKDKHALPSQTSDGVLSGPEFQALAGIFDLAFQAEKGIYACDMNDKAIEGIVHFIINNKTNQK